jgi:hypothetical protein
LQLEGGGDGAWHGGGPLLSDVQSHFGLGLYINDRLSGHAIMAVELRSISGDLLEA